MKIWVRNQLENRVILVDHFTATKNGTVLGFQGPQDDCGVVLGTYETEIRAMEVLSLITIKLRMNHRIFDMPEE